MFSIFIYILILFVDKTEQQFMNEPIVIGVDSSTTACKAIAWNQHGQAMAEGRDSYPLLRPAPTWFEQNAEHWWRSLEVALKELLGQIDPAASGITVGWSTFHGKEHFYRAVLEGIAFEQRLAGEGVMAATGQPFSEYITLGGGSRSTLWCQIMADVTGVPIVRSTTTEATCLGAGILAATAVGWYPDVYQAAAAMTATAERFTPHPDTQSRYEQLYQEVYRPLFPTLQSLLHRLSELTHPET